MPATYTTDVPAWIPSVIAGAAYDRAFESALTLNGLATAVGELTGGPGDRVTIPTIDAITPADNLAENVDAVDEKISGSGVTITVKEAVKSVAWSDRVRVQSSQDVNVLAGAKLGAAIADRIELDLGAALLAGRNTAADRFAATFDVAALRAMKARIPAGLRRRGLVLVASDVVLEELYGDPAFANAAALGAAADVQATGELSRPFYGISEIRAVDDSVLANVTVGANAASPPAVLMARGMLVRALQTNPSTEVERHARGRLTRIVGTALHGEGVVDSRGVVVTAVGQ